VQLTIVVPSPKIDPDSGAQTTAVGPSPTSLADALYIIATPPDDSASFVIFAGIVRIGGVVSRGSGVSLKARH
jgi:hypothetical protein